MHHAMRRVGVAALSAGALFVAGAAPAQAAGEFALTGDESATWDGTGLGANVVYGVTEGLLGCASFTPLDACDQTVLKVTPSNAEVGPATLSLAVTMSETDTADFDLVVYEDKDGDMTPDGDPLDDGAGNTGNGGFEAETLTVANASGQYLVEIVYFTSANDSFEAVATLDSPAAPTVARSARTAAATDHSVTVGALKSALAAARK